MSKTAQIVSGDDVSLPITLYKDGATFAIASNAVIKATIVDEKHTQARLASPVTVSNVASGTDLAHSKVIFELTSVQSAALNSNDQGYIEVQVDDAGKETFFVPVKLVKGFIS